MLRDFLCAVLFSAQYVGEKSIQYIIKHLANVSFFTPLPEGRKNALVGSIVINHYK